MQVMYKLLGTFVKALLDYHVYSQSEHFLIKDVCEAEPTFMEDKGE